MSTSSVETDLIVRVQGELKHDLAEVSRIFQEELDSNSPFVKDMISHVGRFSGKKMRPLLLLLAGRAFGNTGHAHHVMAAVVEMIHTATLVHDDVLDSAETRRHVATVNTRWNNHSSVLLGDYMFTHAFHLSASLGDTKYCRLIAEATNRVCVGELSQIRSRGNFGLTEDEYFEIINGKTAELCAVSARLGALCSGADEAQQQAFAEYGHHVGIAFQICDDIQDLIGEECSMGKTLGTDLQQQKLTLPLIHLLQVLEPKQRDHLVSEISQLKVGDTSQEAMQLLSDLMSRHESINYAYEFAKNHAEQATQALRRVRCDADLEYLQGLAMFAVERRR